MTQAIGKNGGHNRGALARQVHVTLHEMTTTVDIATDKFSVARLNHNAPNGPVGEQTAEAVDAIARPPMPSGPGKYFRQAKRFAKVWRRRRAARV